MPLTKVTGKGLNDSIVDSAKLGTSSVTETKIADSAVTSAKISDGVVSADDLSSSLNLSSKTITLPSASVTASMLSSTLDLSSKTVTLPLSATATLDQNIALLGFKMAITDGLTIFNLVDGVVDEFEDESGVDNSASTSLTYNSTDDFYVNSTQPTGVSACYSAGFTTSAITEPDTSVTGTNPALGSGTSGTFTVPSGLTSVTAKVWGSGGGGGTSPICNNIRGGGGGFSSGTLAVTPGQTLHVSSGEGGAYMGPAPNMVNAFFGGGKYGGGIIDNSGGGGGLSGIFSSAIPGISSAPQAIIVAGSGGGAGSDASGGGGGGTTGIAGNTGTAQTNNCSFYGGGGGSQAAGGQGAPFSNSGSAGPTSNPGPGSSGQSGGLYDGGDSGPGPQAMGAGGSGFYGGGGGGGCTYNSIGGAGGGGSSYISNPNITCGATESADGCGPGPYPSNNRAPIYLGGGTTNPDYVPGTNNGSNVNGGSGNDGYVLISASLPATTTSSTIISDPFTSTTVPTTSRIVVFEENVGTPSLNTDIIASISRNGGTNFTTATLTDSGYVTGSSGQRILTGTATISGQPSGQSMKWKLQLANNTVKIHGVALQWK